MGGKIPLKRPWIAKRGTYSSVVRDVKLLTFARGMNMNVEGRQNTGAV